MNTDNKKNAPLVYECLVDGHLTQYDLSSSEELDMAKRDLHYRYSHIASGTDYWVNGVKNTSMFTLHFFKRK